MDDFDLRDWCYNCINLSEYYTENGYYAQAEYLLVVGMGLVNIEEDDPQKLVATFQMTLGKVFLEMLNFCTTAQVDAKLKEIANECILTISGVN